MTLIALTVPESVPCLMGDILITAVNPDKTYTQTEIPTYLEKYENIGSSEVFPLDLRQKVYVISDRLCLGLAGNVYEMKRFLSDAKLAFRYTDVTPQAILDFCNERDAFSLPIAFMFLGCKVEKTTTRFFTHQSDGWQSLDHDYFGNCKAVGTGTIAFFYELSWYHAEAGGGTSNKTLNAVAKNMYLLMQFIGRERMSAVPTTEGWGAGFELIVFDGSKFSKLDDITYLYWAVEPDPLSKYRKNLLYLMNFKYFGEELVITAVDYKKTSKYVILPLDKELQDVDLNALPKEMAINMKHIACCYLKISDEKFEIVSSAYTHVQNPGESVVQITVNNRENSITIDIDEEFEAKLLTKLNEY